ALVIRAKHAEADERLTLERIGNADRRGLDHVWILDQHRFAFSWPEPLPSDLDRVVRAAEDVPQPIVIDRSPITMDPDIGEARPVGLHVKLGVVPETTRQ